VRRLHVAITDSRGDDSGLIRGKAHAPDGPSLSACNLSHQSVHAIGFTPARSSLAPALANTGADRGESNIIEGELPGQSMCARFSLSFCDGAALDTAVPNP